MRAGAWWKRIEAAGGPALGICNPGYFLFLRNSCVFLRIHLRWEFIKKQNKKERKKTRFCYYKCLKVAIINDIHAIGSPYKMIFYIIVFIHNDIDYRPFKLIYRCVYIDPLRWCRWFRGDANGFR